MNNKIKALKNPELRNDDELNHPAGMQDIEDSALSTITGGCTPSCGGGGPGRNTTFVSSCVPPNGGCP